MEHDTPKTLVHRPGTDPVWQERRTHPIIARMTQDVLERAQRMLAARFSIGDYHLREADYRQILRWAEAGGMAPEAVLEAIVAGRIDKDPWETGEPVTFALEDGAILSLAWKFDRLPFVPEKWESGLMIRTLGFRGKWPDSSTALRPRLPRLQSLER